MSLSDDNVQTGKYTYGIGDQETKDWFHRSWAVWPERVDPSLTTNGSLHYGGLLQYRLENDGADPEHMSDEFRQHVAIMDRFHTAKDPKGGILHEGPVA